MTAARVRLSPAEKQKRNRQRRRDCVRVYRLPLHEDTLASVLYIAGVPEGTGEEDAMKMLGEWLEVAAELTD